MSRRGLKNFIRLLPGPQSYCKCENLCSEVTIEHVIPKSLIKQAGYRSNVSNDLHNIYPCCKNLNQEKGSLLFGKDFLFEEGSYHTGALARTCLYMYDKYDLPINTKVVSLWREFDNNYMPEEFEYHRNKIIYRKTGTTNPYLVPVDQ